MSVYDDWDDRTAEESILLLLLILIVSHGNSVNENNKIVTIGILYTYTGDKRVSRPLFNISIAV